MDIFIHHISVKLQPVVEVSSSGSPGTGFGSPQCGQVSALGETALLQTLHGFNSGFSSSGTATQ